MKRKLIVVSLIIVLIVAVAEFFITKNGFKKISFDEISSSSSSKSQSVIISESKSLSSSSIASLISVTSNEGSNLNPIKLGVTLNIPVIMNLSNSKICWGAGNSKNGAQPFISNKTKEILRKYNAYWIGSTDSKKNYLTFDEGYENDYTAKILDTLKEKNVKAVFFVTKSYVKSNKVLVKRMIDEGHIIGNHSCTHPSFPDLTLEKVQSEVLDLHEVMLSEFNYDMYMFRYPNGDYSDRVLAAVDELGYTSIFWSFAYKDYDVSNQPGEDFAYNKVISNAHNGAIYLIHAVSKDNADALGRIIDTLREKGYEITQLKGKPE
jgi:peptidoglycan-N-acetylmuramic acid deacetylase